MEIVVEEEEVNILPVQTKQSDERVENLVENVDTCRSDETKLFKESNHNVESLKSPSKGMYHREYIKYENLCLGLFVLLKLVL